MAQDSSIALLIFPWTTQQHGMLPLNFPSSSPSLRWVRGPRPPDILTLLPTSPSSLIFFYRDFLGNALTVSFVNVLIGIESLHI